MENSTDLVYAAVGKTVMALDRFTGHPVWRFKLPGGWLTTSITTLTVSGNEVYAARAGYMYCLDRFSGQVLWERGLRGGSGTVLLALPGDSDAEQMAVAEMVAQQQRAAAVAASG